MNPLVTPEWIASHPEADRVIILDASIEFQIPFPVEKDQVNLIPGSLRFDYDTVFCDPDNALPHMMPTEERFTHYARELGINFDSIIVVYDNQGTLSSPRAWWMLKAMGHQHVFVLDGGLTEWKNAGLPLAQHYDKPKVLGNFTARSQPLMFVDADYVEQNIPLDTSLTVDARSQQRFDGKTPEPREGVRSGHIPNSVCLPFMTLLDQHKLASKEKLIPLLDTHLPKHKSEYLFSCGSGVTACIILLAAYICGYNNLSIYDGSWTEWGASSRPIE